MGEGKEYIATCSTLIVFLSSSLLLVYDYVCSSLAVVYMT